jgi:hypothetical protein
MKKLVKFYICSIASYGTETWKLQKTDQKYWKVMWCYIRMKISWTDHVRNEEVLHSHDGQEYPTYNKKEEV